MSKKSLALGACVLIATFFIAMIPANVSADGTPFEYLSEEWRFSTDAKAVFATEDLDERAINMISLVSESNINTTIQTLQDFDTRYVFSENCTLSAEWIYSKFSEYGLWVKYDYFEYENHTLKNVVATLNSTSDNIYIISSHYDSINIKDEIKSTEDVNASAPGADGGASGVAGVLECARIMGKYGFNATVKFVLFSAEEQGLVGSRHYAESMKSNGEKIIGDIQLDMIGYGNDSIDIVTNPESEWIAETMENVSFGYGIGLDVNKVVNSAKYSDHASFWDNGYSAVCLIENATPWNSNPYFHSKNDTIEKLNSTLIKKTTQMCIATLATTLKITTRPVAYIDLITPNPSISGESVSFTGHGVDDNGSIVAYSWSSNISGTISTSNVFSTSSLPAGNHLISFKVQDNSGLWSDEVTAILEVRQSPVASLTVEPTTVYINELVSFDGSNSYQTGGTITHYFFDFGDDTNSSWTSSHTTSHEYSDKGTYYAKLKVKDNYGIESSWSSVKITVQETPVLVLTAGLTNVGVIKSGGERVVPVYVTCYNMSAKNVRIVVVEASGFIITMIPAEEDVNVGDTVTFNLKLTAPELAGNVTVGEKVIQIKAVSDETESNVETIYIVLEKGAGTGQHGGFIPSFEAVYLLAIIGICSILLKGGKKNNNEMR